MAMDHRLPGCNIILQAVEFAMDPTKPEGTEKKD